MRGDRRLGIDLNEGDGVGHDDAADAAKRVGSRSASISLNWDQLEPRPGKFVDPNSFLYLIDTYYPGKGLTVDLFIRAVDTDGEHVPSDLKKVAFDDERMIGRFEKLLDFVFSHLPNARLNFVAIGNELTLAYPAEHTFWQAYEVFYRRAKDHIKRTRPSVTVGAVGTMYELIGSRRDVMLGLNCHSDAVLVSYYPLNADFSVKPATAIADDISRLVELYPTQTIYFSETGYPSSRLLGSSNDKQRKYVDAVFSTWDTHATQIKYVSFAWLHDQSETQLDQFEEYYGSSHPRFRAYLGTLGLRQRNGVPKPAFQAVHNHTRLRKWSDK